MKESWKSVNIWRPYGKREYVICHIQCLLIALFVFLINWWWWWWCLIYVTVTVTDFHSSTKMNCSQTGVMQCYRLVGEGGFSASIGTAGDCCAVSGCQVEVRSRRQESQWRNFADRWTCLSAKRTGRRGHPNGVTDVTNPRLGRWLACGRQDQHLGHSRRSKQQAWTVSSQWLTLYLLTVYNRRRPYISYHIIRRP